MARLNLPAPHSQQERDLFGECALARTSVTQQHEMDSSPAGRPPVFVDVFAGCGGLSLGLLMAGWRGLFAVEKDSFAFDTLRSNLVVDGARYRFDWPIWLPQRPLAVDDLLVQYQSELAALAGQIDLLVGGPPCQGFSSAGRRDAGDPRNHLFGSYLRLVSVVQPKMVLVENVRGMTTEFAGAEPNGTGTNYAEKLVTELAKNYHVQARMLDFSTFGVPQNRHRFVVIGVRREDTTAEAHQIPDAFEAVETERRLFLHARGLRTTVARDALSDLEVERNGKRVCTEHPQFFETCYRPPETTYQRLLHDGAPNAVHDTRLARHAPHIQQRFAELIAFAHTRGRLNVSVRRELLEKYGSKKQAMRVLDPDAPAPTITSLPDDLLHYAEPRTLTVRENARLQSFPDWFAFRGKYTTGGFLRKKEVPRFTQVANAVPPLVAEAIGRALLKLSMGESL